jgi:hypothetical protein
VTVGNDALLNLYTSKEFLDAIAGVYFASRASRVSTYEIDGKAFRLLEVDGRGPVVHQVFLDMHEPLDRPLETPAGGQVRWLPNVSHGVVPLEEFREEARWERFSGAPTVVWRDFETWDSYRSLLKERGVLKDDLRRRRRLEELLGPLEFRANDSEPDVLPSCFSWRTLRDRQAARAELFADRRNRDFFFSLREIGLLKASTLRAGERLLAVYLGSVYRGRWYGWVIAFDPDPALSKFSLGRQILYPMLEESYRAGHDEFDFSIGYERYKLFFATHVRATSTLGTPPVGYRLQSGVRKTLEHVPWLYARVKSMRAIVLRLLPSRSRKPR